MLWLVKNWQVSSWGKFSAATGNLFTDSWSWQIFVSSCDVFNCLFPLDVQTEIKQLSRFFCYLWLVCLLGFWLRNAPLVKVIWNPISDGIVFVFHLAWCVRGLKSLKRFWPYLMVFRSCILTGKPEKLLYSMFFFSAFMKSSVDYAASLCTFVRFETMIWPQNFKKPLDIFWPQIERKRSEEYLVKILAKKRKLWKSFKTKSSSWKISNTGKPP